MDGNGVWRFPEGSGRQGKVERYYCNVIYGAPTTSEFKGLGDERLETYFPFFFFQNALYVHVSDT